MNHQMDPSFLLSFPSPTLPTRGPPSTMSMAPGDVSSETSLDQHIHGLFFENYAP